MKRRGVIMALIASCASFVRGQSGGKAWLVLDIPKDQPRGFGTTRPAPEGQGLVMIEYPPVTPYDYALEVRFEGRVARLTASEIMDALEGK